MKLLTILDAVDHYKVDCGSYDVDRILWYDVALVRIAIKSGGDELGKSQGEYISLA